MLFRGQSIDDSFLRFIRGRRTPLKRDQSATGLEESASNWPFIKKPPQVDLGAEISRKTSEVHYIYCAADELAEPLVIPKRPKLDLLQGIFKEIEERGVFRWRGTNVP